MAPHKILIVFYSRSGATRRIAEALAAELKCDAEEIVVTISRTGLLGIMRSLIEAMRQRPASIKPTRFDPSSYDLVVIGTPVWAWSVSSPIRAYLIENGKNLPLMAFFCTLGNRGDVPRLERGCGARRLAGEILHLRESAVVAAGRFHQRLGEFVQALG